MPIAELGDVKLDYRERGGGPPCLGIMGWGADKRLWASVVPAVTDTHRFITFDNRGTGKSSPEPATTIDQMAADAVRLLDHLGIERAVVFGVSMGGAIAQRLVLDHPERVEALVLALTFARPTEFMRRQEELGHLIIEAGGVPAFISGVLVRMFTPRFFEAGEEAIERLVRVFLDDPQGLEMAPTETLRAQLDAIDKHDVLTELPSVRCPTLVMGAKMDQMVPYFASEEIAAAIPGAKLVSFETGHGCFIEEMDEVNATIHEFLSRLPPAAHVLNTRDHL